MPFTTSSPQNIPSNLRFLLGRLKVFHSICLAVTSTREPHLVQVHQALLPYFAGFLFRIQSCSTRIGSDPTKLRKSAGRESKSVRQIASSHRGPPSLRDFLDVEKVPLAELELLERELL